MSLSDLTEAAEELEAVANAFDLPLVVCHHDLLIKNLVYSQEDSEYALLC